ncbi:hypothetical protein TNCV_586131 [Trichonephila clavipes]|nr:hypothetical protein TNCV_586131 [Trichonephila clavipes]
MYVMPNSTKYVPCRRGRGTLNMSRLKHPAVGVVWKLGEEVPAQLSSSSLNHGSKLLGLSLILFVQLCTAREENTASFTTCYIKGKDVFGFQTV